MKHILILVFCLCLTGCQRSFWFSSWDKAETERKQYEQLQKQNKFYERIANALESIAENQNK